MMIKRRSFQHVYDLAHRVMPEWNDEHGLVSQTEAEIIMLDNSAYSLGVFREQWPADYYRPKRPALVAWREAGAEQQQIIAVYVGKSGNLWLYADLLPLLERVLAGELAAARSAVLSSFDPVVWDHKHAEQLFDFSYRLKCYISVPKRQYDCFILLLSYHGQLVGRMDAKMHHQIGVLEVISPWLQGGTKPTTTLQKRLRQAIIDFANW